MKKILLVVVLAGLAGVGSVCAYLGDNDDQIEALYGNVVARHSLDDGTVSILYRKDRYYCYVLYDHRRSVSERYTRVDGRDLSEKEVSRFLKANAGRGVTWIRSAAAADRRFERSDHKAEATYLKVDERPTLRVRAKSLKHEE